MATVVGPTDIGPICPICLGDFKVPRQLPCAHSFCEKCLQSYITSKVTEHEKKKYIECPVCRQRTALFKQTKSCSGWAALFPVDTILKSMLPTKSKVDHVCDSCNSEEISFTATGFCTVCKEAMCDNCLSVHRKQKMLKSHTILTTEDLQDDLQHMLKSAEGFTCIKHGEKDLEFYCYNHKIACCSACYFENHKECSNVKMIKNELPALLCENKTSQITETLKKLESHLKTVIDIKESNMNDLESQVNGLADQIREMREKINTVLDEMEMRVKIEGRRIHKEVVIKIQDENHQCLSLIHAIRNSQLLCETVHRYGIDVQKFLTTESIKSQLPLYYSKVRENYERIEKLALHVKFTPLQEFILSLASTDIEKLVSLTRTIHSIPCVGKLTKECQVEKVGAFTVNISGNSPCFTGITILPRERMMLVDKNDSQCILLNKAHQVLATYKLKEHPYAICVVDVEEVAVSVDDQAKIQILSVRDEVINPVRTIKTKYACTGITSAGKGELFVTGRQANGKSCFSLIRDRDEVSYCSTVGNFRSIALNNSKSQVYITVADKDSLYSFNMEGTMMFTYNHDNLKFPAGVAVDREDNIFVVGSDSHNIHQLTQEGCNQQVITVGLPRDPWAISFDKIRDIFMITNTSSTCTDNKPVHIYQVKYT